MKIYSLVSNFSSLTRPLSNVKNIVIVALAFYFADTQLDLSLAFVGFLALSLVFSSMYAFNSVCDRNIDKKNINKRHYSESVEYFGERKALLIAASLAVFGLIIGVAINIYVFACLVAMLLSGILYSSPYTRFKEKIALDIIFGGTLTFLLRFWAAWFIFKISAPPLLPTLFLISAKSGGYLLYKDLDCKYLTQAHIKNSVTLLNTVQKRIISFCLFAISLTSLSLLFVNNTLPPIFLVLIPFSAPPLIIIYLINFLKIEIKTKYLRTLGYLYWILVILFTIYISQ